MHITTSLTAGAGKATRRINSSINEAGGDSTLVTTGRVDGTLALDEKRFDPGTKQALYSKSLTVIQKKFFQKTEFPLTSVSVQTINLENLKLASFDVVNVHATYNLLNSRTLRNLSKISKKVVFTLHDERLYTGGCHNTMGCEQYLTSCTRCPQATRTGKMAVRHAFGAELSALAKLDKTISIIAPSDWIRKKASESLKLKNIPIKKISNPIPDLIYTDGDRNINKYVNSSKITLGFVAAQIQNPYKGYRTLLEALRMMGSAELKKYRLLVIGNSKELTSNLQIEVIHHQSDEDYEMAELLRAIDLLVVPSKGDNSPSVISEALMCGTRVIGSNLGGIPEMLNFNIDLLFDPESPSDLVNLIRKNSVYYERRDIETYAHSKYSSKLIGQEYLNYYRELFSEFSSH